MDLVDDSDTMIGNHRLHGFHRFYGAICKIYTLRIDFPKYFNAIIVALVGGELKLRECDNPFPIAFVGTD
jgi:hypothetical protein